MNFEYFISSRKCRQFTSGISEQMCLFEMSAFGNTCSPLRFLFAFVSPSFSRGEKIPSTRIRACRAKLYRNEIELDFYLPQSTKLFVYPIGTNGIFEYLQRNNVIGLRKSMGHVVKWFRPFIYRVSSHQRLIQSIIANLSSALNSV